MGSALSFYVTSGFQVKAESGWPIIPRVFVASMPARHGKISASTDEIEDVVYFRPSCMRLHQPSLKKV